MRPRLRKASSCLKLAASLDFPFASSLRCPPQAGLEGEAKGLGMRVAYERRLSQRSLKGAGELRESGARRPRSSSSITCCNQVFDRLPRSGVEGSEIFS